MAERLLTVRRREPVVHQVYGELRRAVLDGRLAAGARLVETELAAQLGVSRTPIREAISKLQAEGLVDPLPHGGVAVRDFTPELVEIYGMRQRLEGFAANLAAQRIDAAGLRRLEEACEAALAAVDSDSLEDRAELNNTFHRLLTAASGSPRVIRAVEDLRGYFLNARFLGLYDRETALRYHAQHAQIVAAVRARNGPLAERLVREHLEAALAMIRHGFERSRGRRDAPRRERGGRG